MKKIIFLIVIIILFLVSCSRKEGLDQEDDGGLAAFTGIWKGEINSDKGGSFDMILDIYSKGDVQKVLVSSDTYSFYYMPVEWKLKDEKLNFYMNDEEHRADIELKSVDGSTMEGTYTQYGKENEFNLTKTSDKPKNEKFYFKYPQLSYEERFQQLTEYAEFADDSIKIPFTYNLKERNKYEKLISTYNLDTVTKGKTDVDLMLALLNWVCDTFKHDGNSGMPKKRDIYEIIDYCSNNSDSINCRGLSMILSNVLRAYKIPAKHITCMPKEAQFDDCHVVVQAYSEKLGQWILLDPTYRLILKNEEGDYINLSMLREYLVKDKTVIPNKDAGRNGNSFNVKEYREYMTKNTFRFSCATDFYFGAEEGYNKNVTNMLVPINYNEDKGERTTTSDVAFWALPEDMDNN